MNKLVTIFAVAVMAIGMTAIAGAQDAGPQGGQLKQGRGGQGRGPGMRQARAKMQQEILAKLDLSGEQKKQIAELAKKTEAAAKANMEKASGDRQKAGQGMREIMKGHQDALMKILNKEQQAKYRELWMAKMKEMREKRGDRQGKPGEPGRQPPL